ncbi:MAG: hypothetical protein UT41_C0001G0456 [Candidatus Wolfebacteria bacterium GW2011_GWC2_39_22]|uniref:Uncharacterized protein n=1 Tax=Candidatus Wolfebacteria bacterium GW2011_GWC2_39_22 TaxID=1619013 RepID=A0A0G0RGW8_9BACT|nr:MAG: hypothetical protein UT41_C0001G0456 [Candidatus Wolfebacteria bacterium GW2011_GWC2_39_22]HBI25431.1 hypothetical protein [Candidatus Wolfebacteria bacterium]
MFLNKERLTFLCTNVEIFRIKDAGKISEEARCLSAPTLGVRVPSFSHFRSDPPKYFRFEVFDVLFQKSTKKY